MKVEQAIYGEVKGGHGLRATTGDRALSAELTSRLDLPDNAPPGAEWSPYVSGFPHGDWYVVARTFRDPQAPRAGMVLSHALIAPLDAIAATRDLRPLLHGLIDAPAQPPDLTSLNIGRSGDSPPTSPDLAATAAALVSRGQGPVVRVGHTDFDTLVAAIWWRLWPSIRRTFSFRLSFGPTDVVETPTPSLVCTPVSLVARWREHRIVDRYLNSPPSLAAKTLGQDEGADAGPLLAFAEDIGADLSAFSELTLLEQAYRLARLEPDTLGNTVASIRLIERLSPDPRRGEAGKGDILNRLVIQLGTASAADVLTLRNLSLSGFQHSLRVWEGLQQWLANNPFSDADDAALLGILNDALRDDRASGEWRKAVLEGVAGAVRRRTKPFFSALWRWAASDAGLTKPLWEHVGANKPVEDGLVAAAPSALGAAQAGPVLSFAAAGRLYRLHGVAVAAAYEPVDAARLQSAVEPAQSIEGIRLSLRRAKPGELVTAAVEVADARIVPLAAEAVATRPELLIKADPKNAIVRAVWSAALERNLEVWRAFADPRAAFDHLLEDLLYGRSSPPGLIDRLAATPLGDLSGFPRREELWGVLAGAARDRLLRATSAAWLAQARGGRQLSSVEPALRDQIIHDPDLDLLMNEFANGRVAQGVQVVTALSTFDESRFRRWVETAMQRTPLLPATDAEAIGRLVEERRWYSVVDDLLRNLRWGRDDVRPALRACVSLVGFLDRWFLGLTQVTSTEKWDSLLELAADLYPNGPDQEGLWERSGGRDADLWGGNGRSRWREALGQVRRGNGPKVEKLLREMQSDYATNAGLRFLSEDREFGGKR